MLPQLLMIGASLVGGVLQSRSAEKAKDASVHANQQARIDQQRAAGEVRDLYAPGVQSYYTGLNAMTARLGLPTQGVQSAIANSGQDAGADWTAYGENGGLQQEMNRVVGNGEFASPEDYYRWHWGEFGQRQGFQPPPGMNQPSVQPANDPQPAPAAAPNAMTASAGSFGNTANPTWNPPAAYQEPTYQGPAEYDAPEFQFDLESFKTDPALQWALSQGTGQVQAGAGAGGYLQSGAAMKAIADRGQKTGYQYFANERDSAYNRFNTDRGFGRNVYTDDRNFGRGTFENDRAFGYGRYLDDYKIGRANYESDRGYLTDRYDRGTDDLWKYISGGSGAMSATANAITGQGAAAADSALAIGGAQGTNAMQQGSIWSNTVGSLGGQIAGMVGGGQSIGRTTPINAVGTESYTRAAGINPNAMLTQMPQVRF